MQIMIPRRKNKHIALPTDPLTRRLFLAQRGVLDAQIRRSSKRFRNPRRKNKHIALLTYSHQAPISHSTWSARCSDQKKLQTFSAMSVWSKYVRNQVRIASIYSIGLHQLTLHLKSFLAEHPQANVKLGTGHR